jgi:hypothetical protein
MAAAEMNSAYSSHFMLRGRYGRRSRVGELFERLSMPKLSGRTEADIQSDVRMLLLTDVFDLDAPRLEEQVGDGTRRRIDIAVGATVIEVKKSLDVEALIHGYEEQLAGYVQQRVEQHGSRYNGILTDGRKWWLYEADPATGHLARRSSFELTAADRGSALNEWLQAVLATRANIIPRQRTIEAYLGSSSPGYQQDKAYLSALYDTVSSDSTVGLKRELWARLLRSALGTGFEDTQALFVDHTLLVIEAMAIGHAVMEVSLEDAISDVGAFVRGEVFVDSGIHNVMDAGFFDWVLAAPGGEKFIAQVIRRVNVFDWHRTEHDVLKVLYESVIGATTRKSLGEYYTPDWLAEGIVEEAVSSPLTQRILDPACGSGTFIFHAVRRVLAAADAEKWDNRKALDHVQKHVYGLDIHPVSTVLARITYLLALGERLAGPRGDVWVPVHLGDSIQWHQPASHEADIIRISTSGSDLTVEEEAAGALFDIAHVLAFPLANLDDAATFDRLVTDLTDLAKKHTDHNKRRPSVAGILTRYGIPEGDDATTLRTTFNLLCDLHAEGRDSIWGFYVRNQVRPLWLSMAGRRMDVLVGNPPWVAYRFMTSSMQDQFRAFSEARNIWHGKKLATQQDLVGLFIVRAAEKYLKEGGTFAFVTPLSLFNRQQYEGFRAGKWGDQLRGHITDLWDLENVRPRGSLFPVPAGVVFGTKYIREFGKDAVGIEDVPFGTTEEKTMVTGLRHASGWQASKPALTFERKRNLALTSDEGVVSTYKENLVNGATIFPRSLLFITEEQVANRLGMAAGRVSVRSLRTSQEKAPWKHLPDQTGVVERRFIFDVHLGSTIVPFRALDPWRAILPIESGAVLSAGKIEGTAPGLGEWWANASRIWEENKTAASKLSLWENLNYQNKLSRQLNAPAHRVVYSASGNKLVAVRLNNPAEIIEHALYWLPARNKEEAQYLTAVLNAPVTTEAVSEYQSRGLFGARHFDAYVWRLPIPRFEFENPAHTEIVELAAKAEEVAAGLDLAGTGFQMARKRVRTELDAAGIHSRLDEAVSALLNIQA